MLSVLTQRRANGGEEMRKAAIVAVLAIVGVTLCPSLIAAGMRSAAPDLSVKESAVATLPPTADPASIVASANLQKIAYVVQRDDGQCVVADGKAGKTYGRIYGLAVSPNGKHVAYAAVRDGADLLVYDGAEKREVDGRLELAFSPDGQRLAYTVFQPGAGEQPTTAGPQGKARVVVDGSDGREYDWVGQLAFSPDSKRVAYTAVNDQRGTVVVDGIEGKSFDSSLDQPGGYPAFGPGGKFGYAPQRRKRTAFRAVLRKAGMADDYRARAIIGAIEGKEYSAVHSITFSPDGTRFGYVGARLSGRDRKERAVVDGLENREYEEVRSMVFSPDSKYVAYVARRGNESVVVVGGAERYTFENVGDLFFTPDSRHLAFWASSGPDWFVVVDGVQAGRYDPPPTRSLTFPQPDSLRALARRGDQLLEVVVDIGRVEGR